jgi:nucleoside-diphosphate-sugar epimerase
MKLAIFGGTGRTGKLLVEQALAAGHQVNMLARDPAKVAAPGPGLTVVQGDLADKAAVDRVIAGSEAVIVTTLPVPDGLRQIIAAMKSGGVQRLVVAAGAGVPVAGDKPTAANRLISAFINLVARKVYQAGVDFVRTAEGSGLAYTVARAARLVDGPAKGKLYVGPVSPEMGFSLTRADYANFLLEQATDHRLVGQSPAVANR